MSIKNARHTSWRQRATATAVALVLSATGVFALAGPAAATTAPQSVSAMAGPPATAPASEETSDAEPRGWGSVIKILTSKPACIAARNAYNSLPLPKVKCIKIGKVWAVVPR